MCFLGINPSLWDKTDVAHWLHWAQKEYSLCRPEKGHFEMNGRALCLLTKEDFRRRCPSSGLCVPEGSSLTHFTFVFSCCLLCSTGDVLYEILQCVKQQRQSESTHPSLHMLRRDVESPVTGQTPPHGVKESQPPTANGNQGQ